jgi:hypothetical protein
MRKAIVNSVIIGALAGAFGAPDPSAAAAASTCSARMHAVRQAFEQMPEGAAKAAVANAYNDANHARKAGDTRGCLSSIKTAEAAIKSGR